MGKSCSMEGQPLSVRIFGKKINKESRDFKEEDFPQPEPCRVLHEPSFCGVEARLSIRNAYRGSTVFITGAAGYVGSVVLEQLLRLCPEISRIYLLVRPKRGKSAEERIASLLRRPLFRELYVDGEIPAATMKKIVTLAGDMQEPQMGLTTADVKRLCAEVTHIIHSAASISFTDPVMCLMAQNYDATKMIAEVAAKMTQLKVFTHVSTAYVNSFKDQYSHIEEKIYPLPLRNGKQLDHVQVATELYSVDPVEADKRAAAYVEETGLLNPYTLTKYMTEQLICEYHNRDFPVCIVRPSLVGSIAHFPVPGYFGNSAGSTAYLLAYGMGIATYSTHRPETIYDLIPGDLVGSTVLAATAAVAEKLTADGKDPVVVHACASTTNPIRHIRMFDDIVTPFWTEEPAKYRFTARYTKSSDYLAYVTEGSLLFHLVTLYHNIKFMIIGFLLRLFGMGDLAQKLWDGWTAWRTYNTERVDLQLFYCSRNARMLESIIVPNERKFAKMIWTPKDDWIDYLFTHQWYIKQFFFNQQKKVK